MSAWYNALVEMENRQRETGRLAEQAALLIGDTPTIGGRSRAGALAPLLAGLGVRLTLWGEELQRRYGSLTAYGPGEAIVERPAVDPCTC